MTSVIAQLEKTARAEDIEVIVECSLFEFFNGALKEIFYTKQEVFAGSDETRWE